MRVLLDENLSHQLQKFFVDDISIDTCFQGI